MKAMEKERMKKLQELISTEEDIRENKTICKRMERNNLFIRKRMRVPSKLLSRDSSIPTLSSKKQSSSVDY